MTVEQLIAEVKVVGAAQYAANMRQVANVSKQTAAVVSAAASVKGAWGWLAAAAAAGFGLTKLGSDALAVAGRFDSLERALAAASGSASTARAEFERLRQIAAGTPGIDTEGLVRGSVALQAIGLSAQGAERLMRGLANAAILSGRGMEESNRAATAFGQMLGKGAVTAEELNQQLFEALPFLRRVMEAEFGVGTAEQLRDMGVSAQEFTTKMIQGMERMPKATVGIEGAFQRVEANWQNLLATIGKGLAPIVIPSLELLSKMLLRVFNSENINRWKSVAENALKLVARGFGFLSSVIIRNLGAATLVLGRLMQGIGRLGSYIPGSIGKTFGKIEGTGAEVAGAGINTMVLGSGMQKLGDLIGSVGFGPVAQAALGSSVPPPVLTGAPIFTRGQGQGAGSQGIGTYQAAMARYLAQISENTRPIIDWSRQIFGGGRLGSMGVTAVELSGLRNGRMAGGNAITINITGGSPDAVTNEILRLKRQGIL